MTSSTAILHVPSLYKHLSTLQPVVPARHTTAVQQCMSNDNDNAPATRCARGYLTLRFTRKLNAFAVCECVDVMVIIDSSESIGPANFNAVS